MGNDMGMGWVCAPCLGGPIRGECVAGCLHECTDVAEHERVQGAVQLHSIAALLCETSPGCRTCPVRFHPIRL